MLPTHKSSILPVIKNSEKVAFISDIHSNIFALNAVLNDIKDKNIDVIVNLGDILYGPIAPRLTFERLMSLENEAQVITIRGNQDRQIYEAYFDEYQKELSENLTMQFIVDDLPRKAIDWMQALPFDYQLTEDIYMCHGTPTDDLTYLLEDISSGVPTVRQDAEIIKLLEDCHSSVIVCGHTHIPRTVTLSTGQIVINSGSVGYPAYQDDLPVLHSMQTYSPHANYAILEKEHTQLKSSWQVNHIKLPYDYQAAAELALENGRADWEFALRTGRVKL